MRNFLMLSISIFFFSCQQKEIKNKSVQTTEPIPAKEIKEENKQINDTIFMNFKDEKGLFMAEGAIDSIHPRVYVKFKNDAAGELNGKIITATNNGNIRFNQIIFPDQTSDGPFGKDLKTEIKQKGDYVLVIGHSQMADNPYWGKFKVEIENK